MIRIRTPLATNKDRMVKRLFFELVYSFEVFARIFAGRKTEYAILSSPSFFVTFFSALAFHWKGTKVILDIRDLYPEVLFRLAIVKRDSLAGKALCFMEKKLYSCAYRVLIANAYQSEQTRQLGEKKLLQVRNGFDRELFNNLEEKNKNFTLCYHGNLGKLYDVELLRNIIDRLNELESGMKFLVIGNGAKDYLFRQHIENVTYIPEINHELIATYISRCHVGISTTRGDDFVRNIFPVKIFEYIGAGVPAIVIPSGVSGAMVERNGFGFQFENNQLEAIVEKILDLKNNKELYRAIVQNINRKRDMFTREAQLEKVERLLI